MKVTGRKRNVRCAALVDQLPQWADLVRRLGHVGWPRVAVTLYLDLWGVAGCGTTRGPRAPVELLRSRSSDCGSIGGQSTVAGEEGERASVRAQKQRGKEEDNGGAMCVCREGGKGMKGGRPEGGESNDGGCQGDDGKKWAGMKERNGKKKGEGAIRTPSRPRRSRRTSRARKGSGV